MYEDYHSYIHDFTLGYRKALEEAGLPVCNPSRETLALTDQHPARLLPFKNVRSERALHWIGATGVAEVKKVLKEGTDVRTFGRVSLEDTLNALETAGTPLPIEELHPKWVNLLD